jgi:hypothetical protein
MIQSGTKVWGKGTHLPLTVMWPIIFPPNIEQPDTYYECWHITDIAIHKYYLAEGALMTMMSDAKGYNNDE